MGSISALLLSYLLLYKYYALAGVIFVSAIILPLPTNTVLVATGAFASQGYFSFGISLLVALVANMLGDCFDYFLARRYGRRTLDILHVKLPSYIERLEDFIKRHPGPTIFFTRFAGVADPITNILAGLAPIPFAIFILYDFLGNLISMGLFLCIGDFLGIYWQEFSGIFSALGWVFFAVIALIALGVFFWYRRRGRNAAA
jgi:membrane protein DedA with SNARE-associated domain